MTEDFSYIRLALFFLTHARGCGLFNPTPNASTATSAGLINEVGLSYLSDRATHISWSKCCLSVCPDVNQGGKNRKIN